MSLPNPTMSFSPFAILTAEEMNDIVENIEALADGSGFNTGVLSTSNLSIPYKFSAYRSGSLSLGVGLTKITFETEEYDTGSNFDTSTNVGRFTAPVTRLYRFSAAIGILTAGNFVFNVQLYKNGSSFKTLGQIKTGGSNAIVGGSAPVQLTAGDYVEIYAFSADSGANNANVGQGNTWFSGELISKT